MGARRRSLSEHATSSRSMRTGICQIFISAPRRNSRTTSFIQTEQAAPTPPAGNLRDLPPQSQPTTGSARTITTGIGRDTAGRWEGGRTTPIKRSGFVHERRQKTTVIQRFEIVHVQPDMAQPQSPPSIQRRWEDLLHHPGQGRRPGRYISTCR